jgi:hypothetical protein
MTVDMEFVSKELISLAEHLPGLTIAEQVEMLEQIGRVATEARAQLAEGAEDAEQGAAS